METKEEYCKRLKGFMPREMHRHFGMLVEECTCGRVEYNNSTYTCSGWRLKTMLRKEMPVGAAVKLPESQKGNR